MSPAVDKQDLQGVPPDTPTTEQPSRTIGNNFQNFTLDPRRPSETTSDVAMGFDSVPPDFTGHLPNPQGGRRQSITKFGWMAASKMESVFRRKSTAASDGSDAPARPSMAIATCADGRSWADRCPVHKRFSNHYIRKSGRGASLTPEEKATEVTAPAPAPATVPQKRSCKH